jgi:hypothetical protein
MPQATVSAILRCALNQRLGSRKRQPDTKTRTGGYMTAECKKPDIFSVAGFSMFTWGG